MPSSPVRQVPVRVRTVATATQLVETTMAPQAINRLDYKPTPFLITHVSRCPTSYHSAERPYLY